MVNSKVSNSRFDSECKCEKLEDENGLDDKKVQGRPGIGGGRRGV